MKKNKTSKIEFKLEETLKGEYLEFCESNGYSMSKRIRAFIEMEIGYEKVDKNVLKVLKDNFNI